MGEGQGFRPAERHTAGVLDLREGFKLHRSRVLQRLGSRLLTRPRSGVHDQTLVCANHRPKHDLGVHAGRLKTARGLVGTPGDRAPEILQRSAQVQVQVACG